MERSTAFAGRLAFASLVALASLLPGVSYGLPISGLFNTGVDQAGGVLANGQQELHYVLIGPPPSAQCPLCSGPAFARATDAAWLSPPPGSKWIGPIDNNDAPGATFYSYSLTFDLTGLDPSTAVITGLWSSDNGSQILLNGTDTGWVNGDPGGRSFEQLTSFSIATGFEPGFNSLEFVVGNAGGPTSLLVSNLSGTAQAIPDPTPASLVSLGLLALAGLRRGARRVRLVRPRESS